VGGMKSERHAILNMKITVIYDNNSYKAGLETAWGFSCFIEGAEKTILFDTGSNPFLLLRNINRLKINPVDIDLILLSHMHWDHTGGLYGILENNPAVTVFLLESFSKKYKEDIEKFGTKIVESQKPVSICEDVFSTGALGKLIKEQSLVVRTNRGAVVITGCAHPGIVTIIKKAKDIIKDEILLVIGGFHLGAESKTKMEKIISNIRELGVRYVGPCHCTGEDAKQLFQRVFGENFIHAGAGKVININDLK
jgi:7,8-dihydropterin-6-yl-methyl-4-(beta-D-ribofuranosyl)aminobenzene 5'-phosphate synthase